MKGRVTRLVDGALSIAPRVCRVVGRMAPTGLKRNKSVVERLAEWDEELEDATPAPKAGLTRHGTVILPQAAQTDNAPLEIPAPALEVSSKAPAAAKALVAPLSGMLAGALEISTLWPTEWAKTQMQLNKADPNFSVVAKARATGFSLYRGLPPMLIGAPLQCGVRFSTLDSFVRLLAPPLAPGEQKRPPGRGTMLVAGMMAGTLEAALVVTPMETVKTRLVDGNKGLVAGVREFAQAEGIGGVYCGLSATIMKSASNQALRFLIFNEYKAAVLRQGSSSAAVPPPTSLTPVQALLGGMVAGCLGCVGNTPFDVLKTRMQGLGASQYRSTLHCLVQVVRSEGPLALYKGLFARLARVMPGQGIIFGSYELISGNVAKALGV